MIDTFAKYLVTEKNRSEHTVKAYRNDLERLFTFLNVDPTRENVALVSTDDIRSWAADMIKEKNLPRSVNRRLSSVRSFYRYLCQIGVVGKNPAEYIPTLRTPKPLPVFFKDDEVNRAAELLEEEQNDFEAVMASLVIEMLYQTGMRRSELTNLVDTDVDFYSQTIKVFGKGRKERIVPFGDNLKQKMLHYLSLRKEIDVALFERFLVNDKGNALTTDDVYSIVVKKMGAVSSLEKHSPHVLRHTFATTMLNNGADIDSVRELLGHKSLATTQIYTHVTFEQMLKDYRSAHPHAEKQK